MKKKTKKNQKKVSKRVKHDYVITTFIDKERKFKKITDEEILEDESIFSLTDWCEITGKGIQTYPWYKNTKVKIDEYRTLTIEFYKK
ncbi:MAG: hypothetical protein WC662_00605 [Candidatus Paceibacterota bacterium]